MAVIDIGTTAIRMAIAEIDQAEGIRTLETVSQAVNLGKDTFTRRRIERATIEDCVRVLKSYRRLLEEYGIDRPEQMRVVATSAVREAENRLTFIDRIYSATGIQVEPIDEAEANRITYLGIQPYLKTEPELAAGSAIVVEVGGGSTEVLLLHNGQVSYAHTYRLGSLRLRETLAAFRAPAAQARNIMEHQIERTIEQVVQQAPDGGRSELIALGGDVRFAALRLLPDWDKTHLARLPIGPFEKLTDRILSLSEDELVRRYHVTYPEAETLGPALLAYFQLARGLKLDHILVTNVNLRDGLLSEMAARGAWSQEFREQIIRSGVDLGRKFGFDEEHCQHVARLCDSLFDALAGEHRLDPRYRFLLHVAALLHEIGLFISYKSYHKHSLYLIQHSELFGLGEQDVLLVGLVSRYHRRSSPKPIHAGYAGLGRERRIAVAKMAAMLRVADALDRSRSQRVTDFQCSRENGRLVIAIPHVDDLSLEQLALKQKGTLFEEIFGMQVLLRPVVT
ncbi:MAG TPA: Ppx/GppA phosphatase family protein [Planctomycetaceae bacterium]|nr:Ppx/GppA phosphatase family protein [Planctomycetaceae bacterium]